MNTDNYKDGSETPNQVSETEEKKVSITMIAEDLGIAPSSVSRALNDRPGVSQELQERVKAYARKVGYIHDNAPVGGKSLRIVAMIIGDIRNPFYADLVYYTQKELMAHGYQLCIFNSEYEESKEIKYLQLVERFNFAGVIQMNVATEHIGHVLKNHKTPIVMVNRIISSFDRDCVILDNYEAGYTATRYLIELGHSKIGFILGQQDSSSCTQRFSGFQQAMANYSLKVDPSYILQGDLTMKTGQDLATAFCALHDRPSAMVVANDLSAHGFISECGNLGISVPEELSVIGFDNITFSSIGTITLTSIDPSVKYMAKTAARLMIERIENPRKATERVVIKPTLVERKSTAPYRKNP